MRFTTGEVLQLATSSTPEALRPPCCRGCLLNSLCTRRGPGLFSATRKGNEGQGTATSLQRRPSSFIEPSRWFLPQLARFLMRCWPTLRSGTYLPQMKTTCQHRTLFSKERPGLVLQVLLVIFLRLQTNIGRRNAVAESSGQARRGRSCGL